MQRKALIYAFVPAALSFGLLAVNVASAHGFLGGFGTLSPDEIAARQQTLFQTEAQILDISVDELKNAWAAGKTFQQIAQDKGVSQEQLQERFKAARMQHMKTQLQVLVDKGVITQAQADLRLQFMQQRMENKAGRMGKRFMRGFHF